MISVNVYLCILAFVVSMSSQTESAENSTLIATAMVTRHGDRAPTGTYPNDPYAYYTWPWGIGEPTPKGVRQLYKSGMKKAARYSKLLSNIYDNNIFFGPRNVYVRSSAVNRCIVSAQSLLDGFLPFLNNHITMDIPENSEDPMLASPGKPCPKFEDEYLDDLRLDAPDVLALSEDGKFIKYLEAQTGTTVPDLWDYLLIGDALFVQQDNGLALPPWASGVFHQYIKPLNDLAMLKATSSKKLQVKTGALLNDIIERLDRYVYGKSGLDDVQNILIYSGHDVNVQGLAILLEVNNQIGTRPAYAAVISLELYYNSRIREGIEVKIFYFRDEADENPINIEIPACPGPCGYEKFKRLVKSKLVTNYDEVCSS
ncbi:unnamed protein product [Hermetia illucens]|uniref:acid phosphatase n=3 Tax=Hermetia illucens TaxID=343691 RepID=A0A7R8YUL4_HERIL|nr:unnamed protein product [Hermetia illucens]